MERRKAPREPIKCPLCGTEMTFGYVTSETNSSLNFVPELPDFEFFSGRKSGVPIIRVQPGFHGTREALRCAECRLLTTTTDKPGD